MTAGFASVGTSIPRRDGIGKVTGAALYVDDLRVPGALVGRTVRSDRPHGVLRAIRRDPGFDWSDVVVVTADDVPGCNVVALIEDDQPALVPVGGTVRHVDEACALVAAPSRARAEAARDAIRLEIDPLPSIHSIEEALAAEVRLHGEDNVFSRVAVDKGGDVEAALASCDLVVEGTYSTGAQEQMYIEPQGMIAQIENDGRLRVTGSMQCPFYVHRALVALLGEAPDRIVVTQAVTGGGFGGKEEYPSMVAAHAALLCRAAGRPVRLVYDRGEDIAATTKRHPSRVRHRLGLRADGAMVAADVDLVLDGGAYVTLSPVVLSRAVLHAAGPYRLPHVRIRGRAVATNTPPHGAFRGFGAPQAVFACERQVQKAARALGMEPFALRRRNALTEGDTTATGQELAWSVGSLAVLDAVEGALEGAAPSPRSATGAASPSALLASPVRRGRGLAFWMHGAGFTGSGEERLAGRATVATRAGGGFEVRTSSTDIGQGPATTFAQIAAEALGVSLEAVHVVDPSTDRVPDSGPTVASRTCMVVGRIVEQAAAELRRDLVAWASVPGRVGSAAAAGAAGRTPADRTDVDLIALAAASHVGRGEVSRTVTYSPPPGIHFDEATYTGAAYSAWGWAACAVDVAVDVDSLEVTVERCVHAVDVGRAIHPVLVRGQIDGGTVQALGWALLEGVVYRDGRVANASMTDCIIPTCADVPELETILVEVPYPHGPHGAKGVGEIPMDGPAAAVAGAIEDALGVAADEVPVSPERLERLLAGRAPAEGAA